MKVKIVNKKLCIEIPLEHIKSGLEGHPMDPIKITDLKKMGQFYERAMTDETLNDCVTTFFEEMLDKIGNEAVERGEEGFEIDDD